jgi:16S rRNA (cytidine1402-2'-O)-methyltransferase
VSAATVKPPTPPNPGSGTLYVVATPIGNLADWTHRAEEAVRGADLILCEDTRHTRKLLARYDIKGRLESYHDFNEADKAERLADRIAEGTAVALVSDAGTPTVSDPGYRIVRACRSKGVPVIPIPGASALTAALSVSGLPTDEFLFVGFLPSKKEARRRKLKALSSQTATLVFYEAPHRLRATLADMQDVLGDREAFLGREMTKLHEDYTLGPISQVLDQVTARGEAVIVVEGAKDARKTREDSVDLGALSRQEILKLAAERLGVERKQLYDALFKKTE